MTPLWTADDLARATGGRFGAPFAATGVSIDSRTLTPGDLFVALVGDHGDGHAHVADALARGAAGALVHRPPDGLADAALLVVDDTLAALGRMAAFARARFTGRLVAVTGSVGKTTCKEMLRVALAAAGPTHAAEASYNNHWGVPLTLARMPADAAFAVIEIGMNNPGEIAPLARFARPHVALITTIGSAHIGRMGGIEGIADEKAAIVSGLQPNGVAVLPRDSALFGRLRGRVPDTIATITFGADPDADARALAIEPDADGSGVRADVCGHAVSFRLNAPGHHMGLNALAVLAACHALGVDAARAADALAAFTPGAGRGWRRRIAVGGGSALLLDESYNASSASVRAALRVLRLQPAARRIAVLGDMLELGREAVPEHAGLAPDVADCADLLFACGPLTRALFDAVPPPMRAAHAADSASLAPLVARSVVAGDAILVKGSLGSRMKLVVSALDTLAETR